MEFSIQFPVLALVALVMIVAMLSTLPLGSDLQVRGRGVSVRSRRRWPKRPKDKR